MQICLKDILPPILINPLRKIRYVLDYLRPKSMKEQVNEKHVKYIVKPYISPILNSFSQFNEDLLIDLIFLSKDVGFYVDVGANDPIFQSNTKRFYDRGWCGINIEPSKEQLDKFETTRFRDINLNIGIGLNKGNMVFYKLEGDSTLSSFNKNVANFMATKFGLSIIETTVNVLRLIDIYENYLVDKHVDFITIDTEGSDLDVLKSNDWTRFRPSIIMVEVDGQYTDIVDYLSSANYLLIFNNYHNGIFIDLKSSLANLNNIVNDCSASLENTI